MEEGCYNGKEGVMLQRMKEGAMIQRMKEGEWCNE
jgi:hypothetical protein